ncbi:MAG: DUF962 domain-containing protein [Planctomycetota bacterium]
MDSQTHDVPNPGEAQVHPKFSSFAEYYPYYLSEHRCSRCRLMHVIGSLLVLGFTAAAVAFQWWLLLLVPVIGYGFAWLGHVWFEKNIPATFRNPFYSLAADFVMLFDVLRGRIALTGPLPSELLGKFA